MTTYAHLFTTDPDEAPCPVVLGLRILTVYVFFVGYGDAHLLALADSALAAHGVHNVLSGGDSIAAAVQTERGGLSLLNNLERLRESLAPKERTA